jgi:hypothetical protein
MWENILVGILVALVVLMLVRRFYRTATGKSQSSECDGASHPQCSGCCSSTSKTHPEVKR